MNWMHKQGEGSDAEYFTGSFSNAIPWDNSSGPYYDSDIIWFAIGS